MASTCSWAWAIPSLNPCCLAWSRQILAGAVSGSCTVDVVEDLTLGKNECMIETDGGQFHMEKVLIDGCDGVHKLGLQHVNLLLVDLLQFLGLLRR